MIFDSSASCAPTVRLDVNLDTDERQFGFIRFIATYKPYP